MLRFEPIPVDLTDEQASDLLHHIEARYNLGDLLRAAVTGKLTEDGERYWAVVLQLIDRSRHKASSSDITEMR